jgi:hypothetical protein
VRTSKTSGASPTKAMRKILAELKYLPTTNTLNQVQSNDTDNATITITAPILISVFIGFHLVRFSKIKKATLSGDFS